MTSTKRPRDRRAQILRASAELFHRDGFHGVGMDQIASEVGISGPAIYRHFRGKRDLLLHLALDSLDRLDEAVRPGTPLDAALRDLAELGADRRDLGSLWQREIRHLAPDDQVTVRNRMRSVALGLRALLAEARPGLPHADIDLLCWTVLSANFSLTNHDETLPPDELAALLHGMTSAVAEAVLLPAAASAAAAPADAVPPEGIASRRETLVDTATRLFGQRGYHAVSVSDIGDAAGIAGPSLYHHFTSKGELLFEALHRGAAAIQLNLSAALSTGPTDAERLAAAVHSYTDFATRHDSLVSALISEVTHLPPDQLQTILRYQRELAGTWTRLLLAVRPGLPEIPARIRVHGAITLINDLPRVHALRARPALADDLTALALTVLNS
ncbi:TetR/AcrR family transcriptional regulator [Actinomadura rupiterrae]|uniref:TetR/AcrR family transcriptional regulator n=1 Tax=Actinomadura rupiterrae TaxID=559627 RepID=UPI0020A39B47|nr:TetR/AcrR family transcriptional regulator [Actinomadura rupiterrae]MCP2342586.1 AcrR family transcriptional regulator [Actinomadura rupiterrae]